MAVMFSLFMWRSGFIAGIMYLKRLFVLVDLLVVPRSSRLGPLFLSPAGGWSRAAVVTGWSRPPLPTATSVFLAPACISSASVGLISCQLVSTCSPSANGGLHTQTWPDRESDRPLSPSSLSSPEYISHILHFKLQRPKPHPSMFIVFPGSHESQSIQLHGWLYAD